MDDSRSKNAHAEKKVLIYGEWVEGFYFAEKGRIDYVINAYKTMEEARRQGLTYVQFRKKFPDVWEWIEFLFDGQDEDWYEDFFEIDQEDCALNPIELAIVKKCEENRFTWSETRERYPDLFKKVADILGLEYWPDKTFGSIEINDLEALGYGLPMVARTWGINLPGEVLDKFGTWESYQEEWYFNTKYEKEIVEALEKSGYKCIRDDYLISWAICGLPAWGEVSEQQEDHTEKEVLEEPDAHEKITPIEAKENSDMTKQPEKQADTKNSSKQKQRTVRQMLLDLGFKPEKAPKGWCRIVIPTRPPWDD